MTGNLVLAATLVAVLTLPGWALLMIGNVWRSWEPLQRWCVAVGLSIAVFPIVFYQSRSWLPGVTLGPLKLYTLLAACAIAVFWRGRLHWREWFSFDQLEWLAIGIIAATIFTRFWVIRDEPYPAWSDSLHHVLLTHLTAWQGRLPTTMEPFAPVALQQYHLGLYALSGSAQMLSGAPAHTALLWTAQGLNGLCGLGVYLVLDRMVGRWGAVAGTLVVGLISFQPAWYVNWGRFTQVSSQTILLAAWAVSLQAFATVRQVGALRRIEVLWSLAAAALLNGAVFLLHFRVAAFYLLLMTISVAQELWRASQARQLRLTLVALALTSLFSLALILPPASQAVTSYLRHAAASSAQSIEDGQQLVQGYYVFPLSTVSLLAARPWLLGTAILSMAWALWRRSELAVTVGLWLVTIVGLGFTYRLGVAALNVTNLGAILIMLYIPVGLAVGMAAEETLRAVRRRWPVPTLRLMAIGILAVGVVTGRARALEKEDTRYFMTPADAAAMEWIKLNTPPDAVIAINTYFWLPTLPHGTDGGYWIPYFTGRFTTASNMLFGFGPTDYRQWTIASSRAVERLVHDPSAVKELERLGVEYIYLGNKGNSLAPGLDARRLREISGVRLLYERQGVTIWQIQGAARATATMLSATPAKYVDRLPAIGNSWFSIHANNRSH